MVTVVPPRPYLTPRASPVVPPEVRSLPNDLEEMEKFLGLCRGRIESEVVQPLLSAEHLAESFLRVAERYQHWTLAAWGALLAVLDYSETSRLASQSLARLRALSEELGPQRLEHRALRAFQEGISLIATVQESIVRLVLNEPDKLPEAGPETNQAGLWIIFHSICASTVSYYLLQPSLFLEDVPRKNSTTLALWSFHYADRAYLYWGTTELKLGLSSKL